MIYVIFQLLGIDPGTVNIDDNVVYVVSAFLVFYCLCYMFNFFQVFMERWTSKNR